MVLAVVERTSDDIEVVDLQHDVLQVAWGRAGTGLPIGEAVMPLVRRSEVQLEQAAAECDDISEPEAEQVDVERSRLVDVAHIHHRVPQSLHTGDEASPGR